MKVFISHAALDSELAQLVEQQIHVADKTVDVFRTTRVGQIPAGKEWLAFIQRNLRESEAYLVLLTPWSMARPWIAFETGAAWYSERVLIPVVAGGLEKEAVVEPLGSLQLLSLEDPEEASQVFKDLALRLGDPVAFCSAVVSICGKARSAALAADDWVGVEHEGHFYAWEGPFEDLREGQPKPLPDGLFPLLKDAGLQLTQGIYGDLMNEHSKGYSIVWQVDAKHRRRHLLVSSHSQCLLAKPSNGR